MEIRVKVNSTYNNTIVTALHKDRILKTISTGSIGFKKAKRASTLAAQAAGESLGYWLLLLDKALSQKTPLAKSKPSHSSVSLEKNTDSEKVALSTPSNEIKGIKDSRTGLSSTDSLESLQIKELANPKLKIPNAKLVASGASLNLSSGNSSISSKGNKGKINTGSKEPQVSSGAKRSSTRNMGSLTFIKPLSVMVSGVGHGKFGAIKGLAKMGIKIKRISEITAIPHNGCKPPKMRRK